MFKAVFTCFSPYLGNRSRGGGGGSQGIGTQPALAVFHPRQLKNPSLRTFFFDIVITQNDHPRYVKHVLGRIFLFFTLFGYLAGGGGGLPRDWYTAYAVFHPGQLKNQSFRNLCF